MNDITYNNFSIHSVESAIDKKHFFELPSSINKGDTNWTPQQACDIASVFDSSKNSLQKEGLSQAWIAYSEKGIPIGRIVAFHHLGQVTKTGGIGFFECVNSQPIATALFDHSIRWLKTAGCTEVNGPMNFGEKDRYCGALIDGHDTPSLYMDNHNPKYYQNLFESYGFKKSEEILTLKTSHKDVPYERLVKESRLTPNYGNLVLEPLCFDHINKYAKDIHYIYTQTFKEENRISHLSVTDIKAQLIQSRPIVSKEMVWLAYINERPVAWMASMKDLNQKIRAEYNLPNESAINIRGMAAAVIPDHQNQGIAIQIFEKLFTYLRHAFDEYNLYYSGINAKTSNMISLAKSLNASIVKKHAIYQLDI